MPSILDAYGRHAKYYLDEASSANAQFANQRTQAQGIAIFDKSREQIDLAFNRILQQDSSEERDIQLVQFIDALSSIGTIRYSVLNDLIPWHEQVIALAQRHGQKDLEADAIDAIGILLAYLGYKNKALEYFERALEIVNQTESYELRKDVESHLQMLTKQIERNQDQGRFDVNKDKFFNHINKIVLHLQLIFADLMNNPFSQVTILNKLAETYLISQNQDLSIKYFERALTLSQRNSYRFGELQSSLGATYAKMVKATKDSAKVSAGSAVDLANEIGFEWGTDLSILDTLVEIAPAIQHVEQIADLFSKTNDPRSVKIYELLNQIIVRAGEISSTTNQNTLQKHQQFIESLRGIKEDLNSINVIISGSNPQL